MAKRVSFGMTEKELKRFASQEEIEQIMLKREKMRDRECER